MTSTDGLLLSQFHNESYEFRRPVRLAIHRNRLLPEQVISAPHCCLAMTQRV